MGSKAILTCALVTFAPPEPVCRRRVRDHLDRARVVAAEPQRQKPNLPQLVLESVQDLEPPKVQSGVVDQTDEYGR